MSRATADSEKSLRGIPRAVLALPSVWKPAIRESREARLEEALVFIPSSEVVVDFFLAAFTFKGLFLVDLARLFFITSPMPFFFKLPKVVDFFDFCIFTGILAAFDKGDIFLALFMGRFFFLGDWATSFMLLEEGLLEFSIFDVQGAD